MCQQPSNAREREDGQTRQKRRDIEGRRTHKTVPRHERVANERGEHGTKKVVRGAKRE